MRSRELHAVPWSRGPRRRRRPHGEPAPPWCPLPERLTPARPAVGRRRTPPTATRSASASSRGWDALRPARAPAAARDLVERLGDDPAPLVAALGRLPSVGLHGDLKLANVALVRRRRVAFIDWQMTLRAPVAVELGWFLVTNSAAAAARRPTRSCARYHESLALGRRPLGRSA